MGRLNNSEFLTQVGTVLEQNQGKSSVYLTQKRLIPALDVDQSEPISDLSSNVIDHTFNQNLQEYPILIRIALNGDKSKQKVKISTVVEVDNLDLFWADYAQTLKTGFTGLKKKDKKKSKKNKVSK